MGGFWASLPSLEETRPNLSTWMHAVALTSPTACVTTAGWERRRRLNGYIHMYVYINSYRYNIILARLIHAFQLHSHHSSSFSHVEFGFFGNSPRFHSLDALEAGADRRTLGAFWLRCGAAWQRGAAGNAAGAELLRESGRAVPWVCCFLIAVVSLYTNIHTCMHTYRQTDSQTARQPDRQTADRLTDRQTDIHTYRHTYIQTYIHRYIHT